eukprot:361525-Chlamydomonas_euryale.AAC.5
MFGCVLQSPYKASTTCRELCKERTLVDVTQWGTERVTGPCCADPLAVLVRAVPINPTHPARSLKH